MEVPKTDGQSKPLPPPPRNEARGRYFDGISAEPKHAILNLGVRTLTLRSLDGDIFAHWPLASLQGQLASDRTTLQLTPNAESDERIVLNDSSMVAAISATCPGLFQRKTNRRLVGKALIWGVGAIGAVLAMVFVIIPALAGQLALMIPPEKEQQLGKAVAKQVLLLFDYQNRAFCSNADGVAALRQLQERIAPENTLLQPVRVGVIDHDLVNAFALPGGRIILMRGLIDAAETPEEVAGVLAHEVAHVIHRDPTVAALRVAGTAGVFGLMVGDVFGAGAVTAMTEKLVNANYNREVEQRADETAYTILGEAELPTEDFATFFARLAEKHGDLDGVLKYFNSHPGLRGRAERAEAANTITGGSGTGGGAFEPVLDAQGWAALRQICDRDAVPEENN